VTVQANFFNRSGARFQRNEEPKDVTFRLYLLPPQATVRFTVTLTDFNPSEPPVLDKTTFEVVNWSDVPDAEMIEIPPESLQYSGGRMTCRVRNGGQKRLYDLVVWVQILDGTGRVLHEVGPVKGKVDLAGVLAPGDVAKFAGEVDPPIMVPDPAFEARAYGEVGPEDVPAVPRPE
jgi:hypothetical protein